MLAAHLPAASSVTRAATKPRSAIALPLSATQKRSFWRQRGDYDSPADPEYAVFQRKRQQRARAALRDALRRRSKWGVPVSFSHLFGARQASHWSKTFKRWPQLEKELRKSASEGHTTSTNDMSPGEKRWRKHMQTVKDLSGSDPYRAVFGRPFTPLWTPSLWDPTSQTAGRQQDIHATAGNSQPRKSYTETSSFSYSSYKRPGEAPVVQASTTRWDSASNTATTFRFDPISGRMVPETAIPKNSTDGLTADSIRASMGRGKGASVTSPSEATRARLHTMTEGYEKQSRAVDQQLSDAQKSLESAADGYSTKPTGMQTSFVEEKIPLAAEFEGVAKPQEVNDGYSTAPTGMQTSFTGDKTELAAELLEKLKLKESDDGYSKKPTGMQTSYKQDDTPLEDRLAASHVPVEQDDGYSKEPTGMQTSYKSDDLPLEHRLASEELPVEHEDGYSKEPTGMQTSYKSDDVPLDQRMESESLPIEHEDGYSKEPTGMQTSYKADDVPLEERLETESLPVEHEDGYSKEPTGMQTSYKADDMPLEERLEAESLPVEHEDGYSKEPTGMQTSYTAEDTPLEHRFASEHIPVEHEDGYSREPTGMQTSYTTDDVPLEERMASEVAPVENEDGYSKEPVGMQTSYTTEQEAWAGDEHTPLERDLHERLTEQPDHDDGYSKEPTGIQTSYTQEQDGHEDDLQSILEKEMLARLTEDPNVDDGYSKDPMGMQTNYEAEQQDVLAQKRAALVVELNSLHKAVEIDDGYSNLPIGLQKAFKTEQEDVENQGRPSLAEEIELNERLALEQQLGQSGTSQIDELAELAAAKRIDLEKELESARLTIKALEEKLKLLMFNAKNTEQELKAERSTATLKDLKEAVKDIPEGLQILSEQKQRVAALEQLNNEAQAQKPAAAGGYDSSTSGLFSKLRSVLPGSRRPYHAASSADRLMQGEGDLSRDVAKFAIRKKLYKQMHTTAAPSSNEDLVKEIVQICQDAGLLDQHHDLQRIQQRLMSKLHSIESTVASRQASGQFPWSTPPSYKILAYDSAADAISTVTTTSRFSDVETPISVSRALSLVSEPARFVSHFASLQKEGYQAIHASPDLLVLRKASVSEPAMNNVNPIDGTQPEPQTGNFASPTGFVNHDPLFPPEGGESIRDGVYYRKVRRQEPVFSGRRETHDHSRWHRERKRAWKRRVRFAVGVGATSAAMVYALGVGAELAKGEKK